MRKITVFFVLIGLSCFNSISQSTFKLDTILKTGDTLISYNLINNIEIKSVNIKKKPYKVYINNEQIDSIGARILNLPILFEKHIYINALFQIGTEPEKKICISNNREITFYQDVFEYDNGIKQAYKTGKDLLKIFFYNPITKSEQLYCDFSDIVKRDLTSDDKAPLEEIEDIFFIKTRTAFVRICNYGPFAECWKSRYFLVNEKGDKYDITSKIEYISKDKIDTYSSYISFSTNGYERESLYLQILENKAYKHEYKNRLFDDKFNLISEVLYFEPNIRGVYIQNDIVQNYFLNSKIQNNEWVIVPYKFIPELDIAMYKVYNDTQLTPNDIKSFGKYELGILRNLIFAKHNYDFSSEFYQAYFNLYAFYNTQEMRNSRTKDVNGKLTEADKANLELIKRME